MKAAPPKSQVIHIYLPDESMAALVDQAVREERPVSTMARILITRALKAEAGKETTL